LTDSHPDNNALKMMKALRLDPESNKLSLEEVPRPELGEKNNVLVKVDWGCNRKLINNIEKRRFLRS
jgi:hypothetical protein